MRTTIDLPDDLHRLAQSLARDTSRSLSDIVAELMRRGLGESAGAAPTRSARTELPVVELGKVITTDDVRAVEDE
ncbi:antitoxin [Saccharomonospora piscinae]|uniref:antitoxin n=1 Tax=Saccharomonospora piscinae TaxID=687388 RepID=UPI001105BFA1|nr:antitoxin [Saccharomonospora piscinae]TLW94697.1 antitoxin [Saccharomonospora piscinae]